VPYLIPKVRVRIEEVTVKKLTITPAYETADAIIVTDHTGVYVRMTVDEAGHTISKKVSAMEFTKI